MVFIRVCSLLLASACAHATEAKVWVPGYRTCQSSGAWLDICAHTGRKRARAPQLQDHERRPRRACNTRSRDPGGLVTHCASGQRKPSGTHGPQARTQRCAEGGSYPRKWKRWVYRHRHANATQEDIITACLYPAYPGSAMCIHVACASQQRRRQPVSGPVPKDLHWHVRKKI